VLAKVEQHVDKRRAHLARGTEVMAVIALGPDGAVSVDGAIDGAGTTDAEALQTASKVGPAVRFDE
jgi:hypothetical protein